MKTTIFTALLIIFGSFHSYASCDHFTPRKFQCETIVYDISANKNILSELSEGTSNTNDDDAMEIGYYSKSLEQAIHFSIRIEFSGPQCESINPKMYFDVDLASGTSVSSAAEFVQNSGTISLLINDSRTSTYKFYIKCR